MKRSPSQFSNLKPEILARSAPPILPPALVAFGCLLISLPASAHPGHALGEHGALHVVTSPYHLGVLAVAGAALWFGGRFIERRMPRRVLRACGILALVAAGVLWGLRS